METYQPLYIATDRSITAVENDTTNIQFCKNKSNNKINTISVNSLVNKNSEEDLNLSAFNGTTINPIIQINNTNNDCNITSNLNIGGNLNVSGNLILTEAIDLQGNVIRFRVAGDTNHTIGYVHDDDLDGVEIKGFGDFDNKAIFRLTGTNRNEALLAGFYDKLQIYKNLTVDKLINCAGGINYYNNTLDTLNKYNNPHTGAFNLGHGGGDYIYFNPLATGDAKDDVLNIDINNVYIMKTLNVTGIGSFKNNININNCPITVDDNIQSMQEFPYPNKTNQLSFSGANKYLYTGKSTRNICQLEIKSDWYSQLKLHSTHVANNGEKCDICFQHNSNNYGTKANIQLNAHSNKYYLDFIMNKPSDSTNPVGFNFRGGDMQFNDNVTIVGISTFGGPVAIDHDEINSIGVNSFHNNRSEQQLLIGKTDQACNSILTLECAGGNNNVSGIKLVHNDPYYGGYIVSTDEYIKPPATTTDTSPIDRNKAVTQDALSIGLYAENEPYDKILMKYFTRDNVYINSFGNNNSIIFTNNYDQDGRIGVKSSITADYMYLSMGGVDDEDDNIRIYDNKIEMRDNVTIATGKILTIDGTSSFNGTNIFSGTSTFNNDVTFGNTSTVGGTITNNTTLTVDATSTFNNKVTIDNHTIENKTAAGDPSENGNLNLISKIPGGDGGNGSVCGTSLMFKGIWHGSFAVNDTNYNWRMAEIRATESERYGGNLRFFTHNPDGTNARVNAPVQRMRIDQLGRVGIGKDDPTEKLDVDGTIKSTDLKVSGTAALPSSVTIGGSTISSYLTDTATTLISNAATTVISQIPLLNICSTTSSGKVIIDNRTIENKTAAGDPSENGNLNLISEISNDSVYGTSLMFKGIWYEDNAIANTHGSVADYNWRIAEIRATESGTFGGNLRFFTHAGGFGGLNTPNPPTQRMRIDHLGRVGINKNDPTEILDVDGTIKSTDLKVTGTAALPSSVTIGGSAISNFLTSLISNAISNAATISTFNNKVTIDNHTIENKTAAGDPSENGNLNLISKIPGPNESVYGTSLMFKGIWHGSFPDDINYNWRMAEIRATESAMYGGNLRFFTHNSDGTNARVNPPVQRMRIDHLGRVGIGEENPNEKLVVNGNIKTIGLTVTGTTAALPSSVTIGGSTIATLLGTLLPTVMNFPGNIIPGSDDRIKMNEVLITGVDAKNIIMKLRPQTYDIYSKMNSDNKTTDLTSTKYFQAGLIAQEIYYEVPELRFIVTGGPTNETNTEHINISDSNIQTDPDYSNWGSEIAGVLYTQLIPYIIAHNKIQQDEINNLQTTVSTLETNIVEQATEITKLKTENIEMKLIIDKLKTSNSFEEFKNNL